MLRPSERDFNFVETQNVEAVWTENFLLCNCSLNLFQRFNKVAAFFAACSTVERPFQTLEH